MMVRSHHLEDDLGSKGCFSFQNFLPNSPKESKKAPRFPQFSKSRLPDLSLTLLLIISVIILSFSAQSTAQSVNDATVIVDGSLYVPFNPYKKLIESSISNGFDPKNTFFNPKSDPNPSPAPSNPSNSDGNDDNDVDDEGGDSTSENTPPSNTSPTQSNTTPYPDEHEVDLPAGNTNNNGANDDNSSPSDDDSDNSSPSEDDNTDTTTGNDDNDEDNNNNNNNDNDDNNDEPPINPTPPREYEIQSTPSLTRSTSTLSINNHHEDQSTNTNTLSLPPSSPTFSTLQTDTTTPPPTATSTISIGMTAPMAAGATGTLRVVVTNFEYEIKVGDTVSFWLPEDTFSFPLISYCSATFRSQRQSTSKFGATMVATTGLGKGATFTILCTDTKAASFQTNTGDVIALPVKLTVLDKATNSNNIREYTSFASGSDITAPGLGASGNLPRVSLTPENKMLFAFTTPEFSIPSGNRFMIALATAWYSNPQPECSFHSMNDAVSVNIGSDATKFTSAAATAQIENSGGTDMLIVQINVPQALVATKNYAFWCNGFTMPLVATTLRASGGIFDDKVNNFRAFSTSFELPILRDEAAGTIFNVQLGAWTAGAITTMTASILRFPVELKKGSQISLAMPVQYQIQQDNGSGDGAEASTQCMLKQETKFQSGFTTISTQAVISNNIISFVLSDDQKITNYYAVTQITCDGVLAMAAHPALSNIKLYVYPPGATSNANPLYSRLDGALSQVYPAIIGSVSLYSEQSNLVVGGNGRVSITAKPQNIAILPGDQISLSLDQDYSFIAGVTVCSFTVSNSATNLMSSGGDSNISIATTKIDSTSKWTYILSITESSASKKGLLKRTDSTFTLTCDGLQNPPFEKSQNPTLDLAIFNPTFGVNYPKGRCSGAILPIITPAPLGLSQAYYQPAMTTLNTVTSMNIIINSLTNPIPSALQGGSIAFTLPSSWTPNSSGSTSCQCNREACTGTTTISRSLDYTITFRPTNSISVQDSKSGSSTVIFTCTNVRSPSNPTNALNTLSITSYSASQRIDMTTSANIAAITATGTAGSNSGTQVVHNLVFPRATIFSPSELQVLHSAYQLTFQSMGLQATEFTQKVQTARTFKVPAAFADPSTNTGIIGMSWGMDSSEHFLTMQNDEKNNNFDVFVQQEKNNNFEIFSQQGENNNNTDENNDEQNNNNDNDDNNQQQTAPNDTLDHDTSITSMIIDTTSNDDDTNVDSDMFHGCGVDDYYDDDVAAQTKDDCDDVAESQSPTPSVPSIPSNPSNPTGHDDDSGDENECDCTCHEGHQEEEKEQEDNEILALSITLGVSLNNVVNTLECPCVARRRARRLERERLLQQQQQQENGERLGKNDQNDQNDQNSALSDFTPDPQSQLITLSHAVAAQAINNNQHTHVLTTMECPCKAKSRAKASELATKKKQNDEIQAMIKRSGGSSVNTLSNSQNSWNTNNEKLQTFSTLSKTNTIRTFSMHKTLADTVKLTKRHYLDDEHRDSVEGDDNQQSLSSSQEFASSILLNHNNNNNNDKTNHFTTLSINDVYRFTENSTVIVVATLLSLPDDTKSQAEFVSSINTSTSRDALSQQTVQLLSTRPYFKFSGLSDQGGILPDYCLDGHFSESDGETDVDCGGGMCNRCAGGLNCLVNDDCQSKKCNKRVCSGAQNVVNISIGVVMMLFVTLFM